MPGWLMLEDGLNEVGSRKSYHDVKRYRRRKRWLS